MADAFDFLQAMPTRRIATRYVVRIPAGLHVGGELIDATIVDISDSGARLECDPPKASPGAQVAIELRCFRLDERVTMLASFVRETPGGCALRLVDPDPFLRVFVKLARLLDQAPGDRLEKELSEV
ncbi:MAG: PilZ domain-containing protein [Myxococcota bacterium]